MDIDLRDLIFRHRFNHLLDVLLNTKCKFRYLIAIIRYNGNINKDAFLLKANFYAVIF